MTKEGMQEKKLSRTSSEPDIQMLAGCEVCYFKMPHFAVVMGCCSSWGCVCRCCCGGCFVVARFVAMLLFSLFWLCVCCFVVGVVIIVALFAVVAAGASAACCCCCCCGCLLRFLLLLMLVLSCYQHQSWSITTGHGYTRALSTCYTLMDL